MVKAESLCLAESLIVINRKSDLLGRIIIKWLPISSTESKNEPAKHSL
jgi:hypothetical protein